MVKSADQMDRAFERASRRAGTLADHLEDIGDASEISSSRMGIFVRGLRALGDVLESTDKIVSMLATKTVDWQTAARTAVRGTTLLSNSVKELQANYLSAEVQGIRYAKITGATAEEAVRMAIAAEQASRKAGDRIRGGAGDMSKYMEDAAASAVLLGMSAHDSMQFVKLAVEDAGLSFKKTAHLLAAAEAGSQLYGLSAEKSMMALTEHMDRIQALDEEDREAFARRVIHAAGVQEKASVQFGKYTETLTGSQGASAMQKAAFLSQLGGGSMESILRAINNPQDASAQQALMEAVSEAAKQISPDFAQLDRQMRADASKLTDAQVLQHAVEQEKLIKTMGDYAGVSPDRLVQMLAAQERLNSGKTSVKDLEAAAREAAGTARDRAGTITTQKERDAIFETQKAEFLGAGSEINDKMLDLYGSYERHIKKAGLELMELAKAAGLLTKGLWLLGGSQLLGKAAGALGSGGGALLGGLRAGGGAIAGGGSRLLAAAGGASGLAKGAGIAGLVVEAGLAINKVASKEGRAQMRQEITEAQNNTNTVIGNLKNFGKAFVSPTESLMKIGMMHHDYLDQQEALLKQQVRLKKHQEELEKSVQANRRKAASTADGAAILEASKRAKELIASKNKDLFTSAGTNRMSSSELSVLLASASKNNISEADALAYARGKSAALDKAMAAKDDSLIKAATDEIAKLRSIRDAVYFEGADLDPGIANEITKGRRNAPPRFSLPAENPPPKQENTVSATDMAMQHREMVELLNRLVAHASETAINTSRPSAPGGR